MLISKRSRRKSEVFESRFRGGDAGNFPLRQYLRCREDFTSGVVQALLTAAFVVLLFFFGRALDETFRNHGAELNPWYRRMVLAAVFLFALSVLRRLYYKVVALRDLRREMSRLQQSFRHDEPED